jgi:hypothetical protein
MRFGERPVGNGGGRLPCRQSTSHMCQHRDTPFLFDAQGEVEQISMMKPKAEDKNDTGLLEYLEDIIGTDTYVEPIQENAKR